MTQIILLQKLKIDLFNLSAYYGAKQAFKASSAPYFYYKLIYKMERNIFISTRKKNKKQNKDTNTIVLINKANIFVSFFYVIFSEYRERTG